MISNAGFADFGKDREYSGKPEVLPVRLVLLLKESLRVQGRHAPGAGDRKSVV